MPIKRLKLSSLIVSDEGTNVRDEMREDTITEYGLAAKAKSKLPPLVVFDTGKTGMIVADGFHRYFGFERQGINETLCEVVKGSREDAIKYALGANTEHGLRRTNADKRRVVEVGLKEFPKLSDRGLAEICKVSNTFVGEIRVEIASNNVSEDSNESLQVLTADTSPPENKGNTATFAAPPKRKITGKDGKNYSAPSRPTKSEPELNDTLDANGTLVPVEIVPFWDETFTEASRLLNFISEVRTRLKFAQDKNLPAFREMSFSETIAKLDVAYADLKRIKPYAVCPKCNGVMCGIEGDKKTGMTKHECKTCHNRGFISQFYWDTCLDKETKKMITG